MPNIKIKELLVRNSLAGDKVLTLGADGKLAMVNLASSSAAAPPVVIPDANNPPVVNTAEVSISSPAAGSIVTDGDSITFTGTATDSVSGDITSSLVWTDDLANQIGAGATFSTTGLIAGQRTVTASVSGSDGKTSLSSVAFTVLVAGFDIDNIVVTGASIMNQTFQEPTNSRKAEKAFMLSGTEVKVYNRATAGDTTTDLANKIGGYIAEFQADAAKTAFLLHIGGNDVSGAGGYPGDSASISNDINQIVDELKAAGFKVALSTLTWRRPPASNPTEPYNTNIIQPIIDAKADIAMDLHTPTLANEAIWIGVDGVHPTNPGEDGIRAALTQTVGQYLTRSAPSAEVLDTVIQFGNAQFTTGDLNIVSGNAVSSELLNVDLSLITGATVTVTGSSGVNAAGKGNVADPNDVSFSLTSDALLTDSFYVEGGNTALVDLSNIKAVAGSTYDVTVVASRDNVSTTKVSEYAIGGQTKTLDSTLSTPNAGVTFNGVSGDDMMANGLTVTAAAGSSYAYLSGIRITKTS